LQKGEKLSPMNLIVANEVLERQKMMATNRRPDVDKDAMFCFFGF
jgi:hypothetical protein